MAVKTGTPKSQLAGTGLIYFFAAMGFVSIVSLFAVIFGGLFYSASKAGFQSVLAAFSFEWAPDSGKYGIIPMVAGTLIVTSLATLMAVPLSFGIISYMWIYNNPVSRFLRGLLRFMSGIPTVVYGFCGLFILIPLFRNIWGGSGYNVLIVSVVLCLLILPTMTIIADSALYPLLKKPENLMLGASALGLSHEKSFICIALFIQKKWLITAILLAFSRALGDTLIALMLSGNTPIMPTGIFSSVRVLSGHVSLLTATEISPQIEFTLFLSGFLLFAAALSVSVFTKFLRKSG